MDKETLSNYGWIVICVLVLAVMIALATPFGSFIAGAVENTTEGLFGASQKAMNQTGLLNIANQEMEHGATVNGGTNGGDETTPDTNTPPVPQNGYIPEGAYYLTDVTAATNGNIYYTIGKELVAGDAFPDEVKAYDMYVDENGLIYIYGVQNASESMCPYTIEHNGKVLAGGIAPRDDFKHWYVSHVAYSTKTDFRGVEIKAELLGKPVVDMALAFRNEPSLQYAPKIPSTIVDMTEAFSGCKNLKGVIEVDANPTYYDGAFRDVNFEMAGFAGKSTMFDELGATGELYGVPDVQHDTVYVSGDYTYTYNEYINGWMVKVNDKTKESYGEMMSELMMKKVVCIDNCFENCVNLKVAPTIPNTVDYAEFAFAGCVGLTEKPKLPTGCFDDGAFDGTPFAN